MINWKRYDKSNHGLFYGTILAFPEKLRKTMKSLSQYGLQAEIQTHELSNME
jgi:hypothetical protein